MEDRAITPHPAVSFFCFEVPSQATTPVSSFIYLVYLVCLVHLVIWLVWLNQTNETNQTNQINQITIFV